MMGRLEAGQGQLFYELCLEKLVPPDHLMNSLVNLSKDGVSICFTISRGCS